MVDYRMVALGSTLPLTGWLIDQAGILHTMVGAVGSLAIVMVVTIGRRLLRRRLLGIPIGLMLYLVLDGVWTNDDLLLWPAFGSSFEGLTPPIAGRSMGLNLGLELIALGIGMWAYRRYDLHEPENMERLRSTGHLPRSAMREDAI